MAKVLRIEPQPGQESVWDDPRPPRVEDSDERIQVLLNGVTIADTRRARRVLETSHPPVYYLPVADVKLEYFAPSQHRTYCEFTGAASYYTISVGGATVRDGAWTYPHPASGYEALREHLAVYPQKMEACFVDSERMRAQDGDFYGGWITSYIVGPFKGGPDTSGW
jgi:uncharacterized protein (DUF427 family)